MGGITDYTDNSAWLPIVASVASLEVFFIFAFTSKTLFPTSKNLRAWYSQFRLLAVISDVGIILLGFAASRYLFPVFPMGGSSAWVKALAFSATILVMQIFHDFVYYNVFVQGVFQGSGNGIIEFMKVYGSEGKLQPIIGDSIMVVTMSLWAQVLFDWPRHASVIVLILAVYALPYAVVPEYVKEEKDTTKRTTAHKGQARVPTTVQTQFEDEDCVYVIGTQGPLRLR